LTFAGFLLKGDFMQDLGVVGVDGTDFLFELRFGDGDLKRVNMGVFSPSDDSVFAKEGDFGGVLYPDGEGLLAIQR
jgi:hypothetical protein